MGTLDTKKKMIDMWFRRVYEHINLLESRVRHLSTTNPKLNDYDYLLNELDIQFENIKLIRKVLKNDAFIRGFNHNDIQK